MNAARADFSAVLISRQGDGSRAAHVRLPIGELPPGDVLIRVRYSSLNYKDALALTGRGRIVRHFPMIAGVDFAGIVEESSHANFRAGDEVFGTGFGFGEERWGGYAELVRAPAELLSRAPDGFTLEQTMALGTAGLTAMLADLALEEHDVRPSHGPLLVTGASGGVGGFAVALLAARGFSVAASTGRREQENYLWSLGAQTIVDRAELSGAVKPLASEQWAGAVDSVGGATLANVLASTRRGGSVAACGLAGGADLPATVFPFILRGVNLLGIDSDFCPMDRRRLAWLALSESFPRALLPAMYRVEPVSRVLELAEDLLAGRLRGRVVLAIG